MAATLPRVQPPPKPRGLPCYRFLCHRLRRLCISPNDLLSLLTFGDLQALGKRRYHALARQYHPDHYCVDAHHRRGSPRTSNKFMQIAAVWTWLWSFPPDALLPLPPVSQDTIMELRMAHLDWPLVYEGQSVTLGAGWQVWHG